MQEKIINKSVNGWDYQNSDRIFYKEGYFYDYAEKATQVKVHDDQVDILIQLVSGTQTVLSLSHINKEIIQFEFKATEGSFEMKPFYLQDEYYSHQTFSLIEEQEHYQFTKDNFKICVMKDPFQLVVSRNGVKVFETSLKKVSRQYITPGIGYRIDKDGVREAFLSWNLCNGENIYGLGEKFGKVEKQQSRITSYAMDACGTNTTDLAYKAHPIIMSTRGYGLLLATARRTHWDIGNFCFVSGSVLTESEVLRGYLFFGDNLKQLISKQAEIQGKPSLIDPWTLGVWYSRCSYMNKEELYEIKDKLKEYGIPFDVLNIDVHWPKNYWYGEYWVDCCDFEWGHEKFPEPESMFEELLNEGVACSVWMNPYLPPETKIYEEALKKGYLVKTLDGGIAHIKRRQVSQIGIPDLTNPEAYEWWKNHVKELLGLGIKVVKPDYTDRIPENSLFFNGFTGKDMHNAYIYLYDKACYEATEEVHGTSLVWKRPGFLGTGKFAGTWSGDVESTFEGLKNTLRGGLSVGFTGECYWSSDIAGFKGEKPSEELYIRWSQVGLLCSLARYHGTTVREPWFYGEKAIEVVRHYSQLRYSLIPYLLQAAEQAESLGLPIMRHLSIEFEEDPFVHAIDDQFLLGEHILVAPILEEGQAVRTIYLPKGRWFELNLNKWYEGNRTITLPVSIDHIPVFIKGGTIIPRFKNQLSNLKDFKYEPIELYSYGEFVPCEGLLVSQDRKKYHYSINEHKEVSTEYPASISLKILE
ncbi:TIM-barrel domain-containing protein [Peribacillus muralis]|uniref:glycoside hydrolase family 31 protein n=1 Tax=Peribacillus muralis TaxID=264697 RepID=UPI00070AE472|nr:TIM-barrel domain-containing protein [Peribacillus muralis]